MTPAELVLDASALLRGLQRESEQATALVDALLRGELVAHVPDLVTAEVTNALVRLARAGRLPVADARELAAIVVAAPVVRHETTTLAAAALEFAHATGLTAYDAFYAVLAEALSVPLVTADQKLAGSLPRAILVG